MSIAIMGCQIGGMIDDSHMDYTRSLKIKSNCFVICVLLNVLADLPNREEKLADL
jgi:hypothetical protein